MKAGETSPGQSVAIAADVAGYSLATLVLAVQMAASMKTRLQGYFVEDEDLLRVSRLPISREIGLATARERPTDAERMQRALRSLANRFEESLKREASALQVHCSFEFVRGRVRDIGLGPGAGISCTIIDSGVARARRGPARKLACRILWIPGGSDDESDAMSILLEKFRERRVELVVVDADAQRGPSHNIEQTRTGADREIVTRRWTVEHLLERLGEGVEFECAIVSRGQTADHLAQILKSLTCPVILVA